MSSQIPQWHLLLKQTPTRGHVCPWSTSLHFSSGETLHPNAEAGPYIAPSPPTSPSSHPKLNQVLTLSLKPLDHFYILDQPFSEALALFPWWQHVIPFMLFWICSRQTDRLHSQCHMCFAHHKERQLLLDTCNKDIQLSMIGLDSESLEQYHKVQIEFFCRQVGHVGIVVHFL